MGKEKNAGAADPIGLMIDRAIGALARSANATDAPAADISADFGPLTPLEAAILSLDHDLRAVLRMTEAIKLQTETFETFARAMQETLKQIRKQLPSNPDTRTPHDDLHRKE
jgi:hypothetical protein